MIVISSGLSLKHFFGTALLVLMFQANLISAQKAISTADYDFYINDTLRLDPSQIKLVDTLSTATRRTLLPKSKTEGKVVYYFINGNKCTQGLIKNKNKEGEWLTYFDSGVLSSKIKYSLNLKSGVCFYYYKTAQLNVASLPVGVFKYDFNEEHSYSLNYNRCELFVKFKLATKRRDLGFHCN